MLYKTIILLFVLSSFSKITCAASEEKTYKMQLTHFLPRTSIAHSKFLDPWAKKIEKETNGRLKVKIHPAMSLGGTPSELIQQVRAGAVDAVWTVVGYSPGQFPKSEVFELPFMAESYKATELNMAINEFYQSYLIDEYKDFYVVLLHTHAPGTLHLHGEKITKLEELKGQRIRVPNIIMGKFISNLGAVPVSMPLSDVYEGLTYGMLKGAMMPFEVAFTLRLHEQTNYHVVAPFYTTVFAFLLNKEFYKSLPKDIQEVIDNNSGMHIAYEAGQIWDQAEEKTINAVKKKGGDFYYLSQEEIDKGRQVAEEVSRKWITVNGITLYNKAKALLSKYKEPK
ncbi:MAG: TRAP transporter substrate-binding protein [Rickettsiaceae bacterium]|nr:TRAP transporter substrate-binding protein [Rickettsiaceae bacterium]